jgi:hypothetical protein
LVREIGRGYYPANMLGLLFSILAEFSLIMYTKAT